MARNKTNVVQTTVNSKVVEKAVILPKAIQLKLDFDIQATAWVPKAKANKPMPQICLSLSANIDTMRLNANSTDELISSIAEIMVHLEKNKDILDKIVQEERKQWFELCKMQINDIEKGQIIHLQKVS